MQGWYANIRVSKIKYFPAKDKLRSMISINGHTTGLKNAPVTLKAYGGDADHAYEHLKEGTLCSVSGDYQVTVKNKGDKTEFYHYFELNRPVELIAGSKSLVERIKLADPDTFPNAKAAKDACATALAPLGFQFLPTFPIQWLATRVDFAEDESLERVKIWLNAMSKRWDGY